MKSYTIELRVDFAKQDAEEKNKIILDAIKSAAKHLVTTAVLISDQRKPAVAVHSSDYFCGEEEIMLADDI